MKRGGGSNTMSLSLYLVRIICGSCVLNLVAIVSLEVCSKLRLSGGWSIWEIMPLYLKIGWDFQIGRVWQKCRYDTTVVE